jgi:hypothetical protein
MYTLTPESKRGLRDAAVARAKLQGRKDFPEGKAHALMKGLRPFLLPIPS